MGSPFDPNLHDAIMREPSEEVCAVRGWVCGWVGVWVGGGGGGGHLRPPKCCTPGMAAWRTLFALPSVGSCLPALGSTRPLPCAARGFLKTTRPSHAPHLSQVPDGTVLEEFRKGFQLGDRLLRPAMVKVSFREDGGGEGGSEGEQQPAAGSEDASE